MTKTITAAGLAGALIAFAAFSSMAAPVEILETNETNVTVIYKTNPNWPIRGMMSVDPCDLRQCQEI
jgi:hypothetical protein